MTDGQGFSVANLVADRNFQNALAGFGAGLDPEGVGGALGKAVIAKNRAKAAQETVEATGNADREFRTQLLDLLKGGMTPKESPGLTSATIDNGNITLKGTLPSDEVPGANANVPSTSERIQKYLPFYSALIGE